MMLFPSTGPEPGPPNAAAVAAEAVDLDWDRADAVLRHAVHAGTRPADIFAAAVAIGYERGRRAAAAERAD